MLMVRQELGNDTHMNLYLRSISDGTLSGFLSGQDPRLYFHVSQFGYTEGPDYVRPTMPFFEKSNFKRFPISDLCIVQGGSSGRAPGLG